MTKQLATTLLVTFAALALTSAACSSDPAGPDTMQFDFGTDPGQADPGGGDVGTADPGPSDPGGADPGQADPGQADPGQADPGQTGCSKDNDCDGEFALGFCEEAWCDAGTCKRRDKDGCCFVAEDCDAADFPDMGVCDQVACVNNTCGTAAIADCCESDDDCTGGSCCEVATCNQLSNTCETTALDNCCETDADCDDGNATTDDTCQTSCAANGCAHSVPECQTNTVFISKSFEDGTLQGLQVIDSNPGDNVTWHSTDRTSVSPGRAIHLGDPACDTYYNGAMTDCVPDAPLQDASTALSVSLATGDIALDPEAGAFLGFWVRMSAEPAFDAGGTQIDIDYLQVTADDGGGPEVVWLSTQALGIQNTTQGQWVYQAVNLSQYSGSVKLRFDFVADSSGNYGPAGARYEGVYLDNIAVFATCASNACDEANPLCASDQNGCTADTCTLYANGGGGVCAYQRSAVGQACTPCGNASTCGDDACLDYACIDNACTSSIKAECCSPASTFPTVTTAPDTAAEGFEAGDLGSWTVDDPTPGDNVTWQIDGDAAFDGALSLYFGDPASGTFDAFDGGTPVRARATAWTPLFDVAAVANHTAAATFWLWMSTEYDGPAAPTETSTHDTLRVYVSVGAAGSPEEVWSSRDTIGNSTEGGWTQIGLDLSAWEGQQIKLGFEFDSADTVANEFGGARIDELSVTNTCGAGTCLGSADCDDGNVCTVDYCELGSCQHVAGDPSCCNTDAECADDNECTNDACVDNVCEVAYKTTGCCSEGTWVGAWTAGFEADLDGFTTTEETAPIVWQASTAEAFDGSGSANFSGPGGTYEIAGSPSAGTMLSPEIKVPPYPSGRSFARFMLKMETEYDAGGDFNPAFADIDELSVTVVVDGVEESTPAWTSHHLENSTWGQWTAVRVDLTPWKSQTVQLAVRFSTGDANGNAYAGPFIDDFGFGSTCLTASKVDCVSGADCTASDSCHVPVCGPDFKCTEVAKDTPECCEPAVDPSLTVGFEGAADGWTFEACAPQVGAADASAVWQLADQAGAAGISPQQGTQVLYFGNGTDIGASASAGSCGSATGPGITLDAGTPWTMSFWLYADIEQDPGCDATASPYADQLSIVLVDVGSGAETEILTKADLACNEYGAWSQHTVDVSAWAGAPFALGLSFDTFDDIGNDGKGVALDAVTFERGCP